MVHSRRSSAGSTERTSQPSSKPASQRASAASPPNQEHAPAIQEASQGGHNHDAPAQQASEQGPAHAAGRTPDATAGQAARRPTQQHEPEPQPRPPAVPVSDTASRKSSRRSPKRTALRDPALQQIPEAGRPSAGSLIGLTLEPQAGSLSTQAEPATSSGLQQCSRARNEGGTLDLPEQPETSHSGGRAHGPPGNDDALPPFQSPAVVAVADRPAGPVTLEGTGSTDLQESGAMLGHRVLLEHCMLGTAVQAL